MNLQSEKSALIKQIEEINDSELLKTVKTVIEYGMKKKSVAEQDIIIPEWHKKMVRERRKNAKPEDYTDWNILEDQLDKKYGAK